MRVHLVSGLCAAVVLIAMVLAGCGKQTVTKDNGDETNQKVPTVIFGEEDVADGMTWTLSGSEAFEVGKNLRKEYRKLEDKDSVLSFKLDKRYAEKYRGKPIHLLIEYYETSSKNFVVEYVSQGKKTEEIVSMNGGSQWSGQSVRIDSYEEGEDYDFSLKLDSASDLWLRGVSVVEATADMTTYPHMLKTEYKNSNGQVIAGNVKDYGAVGNGLADDSVAFQTALRNVAQTGGVLYVPAGTYLLTQEMTIPSGVTLLGDFKEPTKKTPEVKGTILALKPATTKEGNETVFFSMAQGTSMNGFSIWYPEQDLKDGEAISYPYTIANTEAMATVVENINLVNVYKGINHNTCTNQQQFTLNIYGTPLSNGLMVGAVNDSGRDENLNFSSVYWLESGLPNVPDKKVLENWLMKYGVAVDFRKIDWHFLADVNVEGYNIGFKTSHLFGRLYNLNIVDCNTCLYIEKSTYYGGQITNAYLETSDSKDACAILIGKESPYEISVISSEIIGKGNVTVKNLGSGNLIIQDSKITSDEEGVGILSDNGRISVVKTEFNGGKQHVRLQENAGKSKVVNCTAGGSELICKAEIEGILTVTSSEENQNASLDLTKLEEMNAQYQKQYNQIGTEKLFLASDYGVVPSEADVAPNLQRAIDSAAEAGGGTVYVSKGKYRLDSPIIVKTGVKLLGSGDYYHYVRADVTYFVTDYGRSLEVPLFTMEAGSSARGFSVSYDKVRFETIAPYAPTFMGTGENIELMNLSITAAWIAIDLNSHRCDNHYVDNIFFTAFETALAVGGGSENGVVRNCQLNCGGIWDNPYTDRENWEVGKTGRTVDYLYNHLTSFYLGDCNNEVVFMPLSYGTQYGVWADGCNDGFIIGPGLDGAKYGVRLTKNAGITIIDAQCASVSSGESNVLADDGFVGTANLYNLCGWAIGDVNVKVKSGNVNIVGGSFFQCGKVALQVLGGCANMSGVTTVRKSLADVQALRGADVVCAFGNITVRTERYDIDASVARRGTDLK